MDNLSREKVNIKEAANMLGVSYNHIRYLIETGDIDGFFCGKRILIFKDSLEAYINKNRFYPKK